MYFFTKLATINITHHNNDFFLVVSE